MREFQVGRIVGKFQLLFVSCFAYVSHASFRKVSKFSMVNPTHKPQAFCGGGLQLYCVAKYWAKYSVREIQLLEIT